MTSLIQTIFIYLFAFIGLTSCNSLSQKNINENLTTQVDSTSAEPLTENPTNTYDLSIFPIDSILSAKVLTVGNFHNDEVFVNASNLNWFGLFKGQNGYYLNQTKIKTLRVYDPVLDENENEKTGWEIQTLNKDTCIFLIETLPFLMERTVDEVKLSKKHIYPNDTVAIKYLGVDYKLFATGKKKKTQDDPEFFEVWDYKLYLTATINGKRLTSLLVAQPDFDDAMIDLIFAGDIDGDGILDLIIDTSRHYNATSPTIYLSKPANDGEIVKPIGGHTSVGC